MVVSTTPRPARERLLFLDAVRGSAANTLLVLLLVAMGRGWQAAKRWYRDHGPALGVFGRA